MAATFPIITKKVGDGGQTHGIEVKRIQQLLKLAGYNSVGTPDGAWGKNSRNALGEFMECAVGKSAAFIEPKDSNDTLFQLADEAGVLIPIPAGYRSMTAAMLLYDTCREAQIPYGWVDGGTVHGGGTRMIWGFADRPGYAIATTATNAPKDFDLKVPVTLNCTGFANLMMSLWCQGSAHSQPYTASQDVGGFNPLGRRYNYTPLAPAPLKQKVAGMFENIDTLESMLEPGRIYHFAPCLPNGYIKHDTVLIDDTVYECNLDKTPAVYETALRDRWDRLRKQNKFAVVYGPGPF